MTTTENPPRQDSAPRQSATVDFFVARQPIFTARVEVQAYELLFRDSPRNEFPAIAGNQATAELISGSMLMLGLDQITAGRPAYINFTRDLLVGDTFELLSPETTVVELLEDIDIDEQVLNACRRLKSDGYGLALDDLVSVDGYEQLLDLVDVVKVDFTRVTGARRGALADELRRWPRRTRMQLLAEKVETQADFDEALKLGYDLFQGHFLSRPVMLAGKEIPAFKLSLIQLLHAANRSDFDFGELEEIIKGDVSLSYKMLRFASSAAQGLRYRIESVRHALVMLGQQDVVRAVSLLALAGMGADKPQELAVRSVVRASLCEALAPHANMADRKLDLFLVGMFSLVDAILGQPMDEVVAQLPTSAEVDAALLGEPGILRDTLDLAIAYEDGDWHAVSALAERVGVPQVAVPPLYVDAVLRADEVFGPGGT